MSQPPYDPDGPADAHPPVDGVADADTDTGGPVVDDAPLHRPSDGAPLEALSDDAPVGDVVDDAPVGDVVDDAPGGTDEPPGDADVSAELVRQLDERTADLQRLQAEYVNYRRRVERDREVVRDTATATVLAGLLVVLDDVDRARQHGELTGGFKAVAEALETTLTGLGLERFGEPGEAFDPRVHEALMHEHTDDVSEPTARTVLQPGYRVGQRVLRAARVAVAEPHPPGVEPDPPGVD